METNPPLSQLLANLGIPALNPMQEAAQATIPAPSDVLLIAPTGSGKTLAYLLPLLQLLEPGQSAVQCLILAPSRELVLQIESVWKSLKTGYKVNVCYGGHSMAVEMQNLKQPPALLIGTPGRLADHLDRRTFATDHIRTLVLDEFDKSLELGFHDQMAFILNNLPNVRKKVLVSATFGVPIPGFARVRNPTTLDFSNPDAAPAGLAMRLVPADNGDKLATLIRLLSSLDSEAALIFCNFREVAERTSTGLNERGLSATVYHGGLEQEDRERALIRFRNGSVSYLVTTDLAARGLDIPEMKHVIHLQLPPHEEEFVHRNGRTARMHASGTAYILAEPDEPLPRYLPDALPEQPLPANSPLPQPPPFVTLYISGGRKHKLSKGDIVGFLLQKGGLDKAQVGRIDVQDFISFVAVQKDQAKSLLLRIRDEKMKGKKYKIEIAR